mgnify:CR=1 FL=1
MNDPTKAELDAAVDRMTRGGLTGATVDAVNVIRGELNLPLRAGYVRMGWSGGKDRTFRWDLGGKIGKKDVRSNSINHKLKWDVINKYYIKGIQKDIHGMIIKK